MSALLSIRDVTVHFGRLAALDAVSFDVQKGEILGLIGPNGAGKTTLLNVISGLVRPHPGVVTFDGERLTGLPPERIAHLGVARTFQIVRPFTGMSTFDNVLVAALFGRGEAHDLGAAETSAINALDRVGLRHVADVPSSQLSVAWRKRLEVAKALVMRPKIVLLDEVMAGLNLREIEDSMDLVRQLRDEGITTLMIEHVMKAVMGLSSRLVVLHHGRVIATGSPEEIAGDAVVRGAYLGERSDRLPDLQRRPREQEAG
ncbi:MAG: ABC transporter ATP-binding protein [Chloroflexota bacterium]